MINDEEDVMLDISDGEVLDPQLFDIETEGFDGYVVLPKDINYDLLMVQTATEAATINLIDDESAISGYFVNNTPDVGLVLLELFKIIRDNVPDYKNVLFEKGIKLDIYEN